MEPLFARLKRRAPPSPITRSKARYARPEVRQRPYPMLAIIERFHLEALVERAEPFRVVMLFHINDFL